MTTNAMRHAPRLAMVLGPMFAAGLSGCAPNYADPENANSIDDDNSHIQEISQPLLSSGCKVCVDPDMTGSCLSISVGETITLSSYGMKDRVSSLDLALNTALRYWTWDSSDTAGKRGIIYQTDQGFRSTNNSDLNPTHWLNTNDDFDTVRCESISGWKAALYADPNRQGGVVYLLRDQRLNLGEVMLTNSISSLVLKAGIQLDYITNSWNSGWIRRNGGSYSSSAGGGDNSPETWLRTNDTIGLATVKVY